MRCLLPLLVLLGAAHAGPFFRLRFGTPEHRSGPESGPELPVSGFPQETPEETGAVFALRLPQIDLSDIFRPLRVFAGVNMNHQSPVIAVREEGPNCDERNFDLTDQEFDVVMDCQNLIGDNEVELKECILTKLPKTTVELRDYLDREEFGVADLSSSFHLALLNGEFTQKRSVQFRLCPRDEVNSIDGEELVPVVEHMVPIETLGGPDRVDTTEPEFSVSAPGAIMPPHRPLFQLPEIRLPDFGQIFQQAFAPVFGPPPREEEPNLGLFGSALNPFAVRRPPAASGPQQGFFASLFPALAGTPPPQGPPDDVDMSDCASKKFEVSRFVFNVANRCQYANDYRKCLELDLAEDESANELVKFAADPSYSVVASSFSSFQSTFDLDALHSGRGLLDMSRKNQIDLRRCANIVKEETTEEAATEEAASVSEPDLEAVEVMSPEPEVILLEEIPIVPEEIPIVPEEIPLVPEEIPIVPEEIPIVPEEIPIVPEEIPIVPEEIPIVLEENPIVLEEYPEQPAPGAEVVPEVAYEEPEIAPEAPVAPEIAPELFEPAPEAPVEPAVEAEKAAVEAEKATANVDVKLEAEKAPVEAEEAPVEAEKVPVEAEKVPVEADKTPVAAEKVPVEAEPTAEAEKATVEAEKAAAGVNSPAEEPKTADPKDNVQTYSVYDAVEP